MANEIDKHSKSPREVRQAARVPQIVVAVRAGVSEPLVRLYEANRDAVKDTAKREALDGVYAGLRGPRAA
jgi:hypothetical protein